jgi:hypothetical protein
VQHRLANLIGAVGGDAALLEHGGNLRGFIVLGRSEDDVADHLARRRELFEVHHGVFAVASRHGREEYPLRAKKKKKLCDLQI